MVAGRYRDVDEVGFGASEDRRSRACIAVIGIDHYRDPAWQRLHNAVGDARGVLSLFTRLGFEQVGPLLLDERATGEAIHRLVVDDLAELGPDDSLIVFFAGHGHTATRTYHGGTTVKDGYLIPVDGEGPEGRAGSWLRLDHWLANVVRIRAKHILVVIDACHSGLALGSVVKWRSGGTDPALAEPRESLQRRRSRQIITSALDDQRAMDGGPVPGHSLFTGCLIEALTGGLASTGQRAASGAEIGHYVQRRVSAYPGSQQTPDLGALELDDRGQLFVPLVEDPVPPGPDPRAAPPAAQRRPLARGTWEALGAVVVVVGIAAASIFPRVRCVAPSTSTAYAPGDPTALAGTGSSRQPTAEPGPASRPAPAVATGGGAGRGTDSVSGRISAADRPTGDASRLSPDAVLSKIQSAYMAGLKRCYREFLRKDASAHGKVSLSLTVSETGRTVKGAAHGFASEVDECITSQISTWRFPIPKDKDGEATDASFEIALQLVPD